MMVSKHVVEEWPSQARATLTLRALRFRLLCILVIKYFTSNKIAIAQMCEREYGLGMVEDLNTGRSVYHWGP